MLFKAKRDLPHTIIASRVVEGFTFTICVYKGNRGNGRTFREWGKTIKIDEWK